MRPHCFSNAWQATALACFFTRDRAGINIPISNAIIAITTKSSINVNPLRLYTITFSLSQNLVLYNYFSKPNRSCLTAANVVDKITFLLRIETSLNSTRLKIPNQRIFGIAIAFFRSANLFYRIYRIPGIAQKFGVVPPPERLHIRHVITYKTGKPILMFKKSGGHILLRKYV